MKNRIRELRFLNGELTQQELADKAGVSRQTIHAIEHDKFTPSVKLAMKIAEIFETKVEDIFFWEDSHE